MKRREFLATLAAAFVASKIKLPPEPTTIDPVEFTGLQAKFTTLHEPIRIRTGLPPVQWRRLNQRAVELLNEPNAMLTDVQWLEQR